ncbi:MAG TPA: AAA family ATPase [Candidatus Kapabacteria bacterium]|nr:AAA family ATPase [Candidatus Kapabacteria bacterium]
MTEAASTAFNSQQVILDLQDAIDFVNRRVINRTDVIEQLFCALLTGEHALIQSRTGVGKSLLTEQVFLMFTDARYFKVQASKEQQPDTYFGGLNVEELKLGKIVHNTEGSLVESEFGFIDEIFDANDFTLRALLSLLNERELILGVQRQRAAIHTVIAATNYLRISEITEALLDRFTYQSVVFPDKDPYHQYRISQQYLMHGGQPVVPAKRISFSTLVEVTRICQGVSPIMQITVPNEIAYYANIVIRYYEELRNRSLAQGSPAAHQRDYYISPRKQVKAFDLLRAIAFMHGRTTVTQSDVDKLYVLFTTVGLDDERTAWNKATQTLQHQFLASQAMEQLKTLLDFKALLDQLKAQPDLLGQPITNIENMPIKRTLREWAREAFGMADVAVENNRRLVTEYLERFQPATDEVRELRSKLQYDAHVIFNVRNSIETPLH